MNLRPLERLPADLPPGISLGIVPAGKLLEAAANPELAMPPSFVRAAIARGDLAFGAFEGDHLVAYAWRTFTAAPDEEGLWARVDRPYHYAYKGFTLPAYRRQGLHVAISRLCDEFFLARGYTGEIGFTEVSNFPAVATAEFLGRRRIGFAGYVKCRGRVIPFRTPGARRVGFQLFRPAPAASTRGLEPPAAA